LPTQQFSKSPSSRPSNHGARAAPLRPQLVSAGRRYDAEEIQSVSELTAERPTRLVPVLGQHVFLAGGGDQSLRIVRSWSLRAGFKRVFDIVGALLLALVFSPFIVAIALLVRRRGGPVIYRHRRIGRDGRMFDCLKFRTMVPHADRVLRDLLESHSELKAEWLRDHKLRNDPRITPIGAFLRRTSLDELPQVWNVLCGEMSLVGPRPVVREELMRYGRCVPIYLSAKPGITGLWQVTGRNDTDYRRRVALDVYYVRKQNPLLDLFILLKTTRVVLGGGGAY
jgi:exopolysaccharide production protein ExoY